MPRWALPVLVVVALLALPVVALVVLEPSEPAPAAPGLVAPPTAAPIEADVPDDAEGLRRIDGTVVDEAGEPVAGAHVATADRRRSATTGADGAFRLLGVELAAVTVVADAAGFARGRAEVGAGSAGDVAEVEIRLEPGASASGRVVDPDGELAGGARVRCTDSPEHETTTGEDGTFVLPPAAVGCQAVAYKRGFEEGEEVELVAGDNELRLGRPGSISGRVLDENRQPVVGAMVGIERYLKDGESHRTRRRTQTDEEGEFILTSLPEGVFTLVASAPDRPPATSGPIPVALKEQVAGVTIELGLGATLTGVVRDADTGDPVAGVAVTLDAASFAGVNRTRPGRTDDEGRYLLEGVPEGPFSVRFSASGYATKVVSGVETGGRSEVTRDAELAPGEGTEYSGIAALLGTSGTRPTIARALDGGPAAEAGLQAGDVVVMIDGTDTDGMVMKDAVQRLRGPSGSTVRITVERDGRQVDVVVRRAPFTN